MPTRFTYAPLRRLEAELGIMPRTRWHDLQLFANGAMAPPPAPPPPPPVPAQTRWHDLARFRDPAADSATGRGPSAPVPLGLDVPMVDYGERRLLQTGPAPAPVPRNIAGPVPSESGVFGPGELAPNYLAMLEAERNAALAETSRAGAHAVVPPAGQVPAAITRALAATGRHVARNPAAYGSGVAGSTALIAPGQTQQPDPLAAATARQTELEKEDRDLKTRGELFDNLVEGDAERIRRAQALLNINQDGRLGPQTRGAIEAERRRIASERARVTGLLEQQGTVVRGLQGGARLRESERNVSWPRWLLREVGPWAGMAAGAGGAMYARGRAVSRAEAAARTTAADANALVAGPFRGRTAPTDRATAANEFWRAGGAGERVPFNMVETRRGFARNPDAATPSSLFPQGNRYYRGGDFAVAGGFGGEAALSGTGWYFAHNELAEAQRAAQADPSPINIARLQQARDLVATAETMTRLGLTGMGMTLGHAPFHPYPRGIRPDVRRAEGIVGNLNQLLARDKPKRRPPASRR